MSDADRHFEMFRRYKGGQIHPDKQIPEGPIRPIPPKFKPDPTTAPMPMGPKLPHRGGLKQVTLAKLIRET